MRDYKCPGWSGEGDKKMAISRRQYREKVQALEPFKGNSVFAELTENGPKKIYVVYSYGRHYPMFVFVSGKGWFENEDKYSVTTSHHHGYAHPHQPVLKRNTEEMKQLALNGVDPRFNMQIEEA
jgi:hypothetical protein